MFFFLLLFLGFFFVVGVGIGVGVGVRVDGSVDDDDVKERIEVKEGVTLRSSNSQLVVKRDEFLKVNT